MTSTATLPGFYDKSVVHLAPTEAKPEEVATFAFESLRHRSVRHIEAGDMVFLRMFDVLGRGIGALTELFTNSGTLTNVLGTKGTSEKMNFAIKYVEDWWVWWYEV